MAWDSAFQEAFHPRSVAVVGVSRDSQGMGGIGFVRNLQRLGFPGAIYPINPKAAGEELQGLKVYPSVSALPQAPDLVILSVPARAVPAVLEDCAARGAKNIHIFTAGFNETGEPDGLALAEQVKEIAHRRGLRILGPNCMGVHVPAAKLSPWSPRVGEPGPVAFVSQSGGHAMEFTGLAPSYGLGLSKVVSFGNGLLLDGVDFLEALVDDPETGVIGMYLEGTGDGRRLLKLAQKARGQKPLIIWKGGSTEAGAKAAASHTGSLRGEEAVWRAFYRQTGAVRVHSLEELADLAMTFLYLRPARGRRVALLGAGGGNTVAAADVCSREGLELPTLSPRTMETLRSFIPVAGTFIKNPLDIGVALRDITLLERALVPIAADPAIDAFIFAVPMGMVAMGGGPRRGDARETPEDTQKRFQALADYLVSFTAERSQGKPLLLVLQETPGRRAASHRVELRDILVAAKLPVFLSLERASRAFARFTAYHRWPEP